MLGPQRGASLSPAVVCRAGHGANLAPGQGLVAISVALLSVPAALALETVELPSEPPSISSSIGASAPAARSSNVSQLLQDYPALPYAGALLVAAPALAAGVSRGGGKVKATTPDGAYAALVTEEKAVLVDIRSVAQRASGSPDLKGLKKSVLQLPFTKARIS